MSKIGESIYVQLKDKGTIFQDTSQRKNVTGTKAVLMKKTKKVADAIKVGILTELSKDDADKANKAFNAEVAKASKESLSKKEKVLVAKLGKAQDLAVSATAEKESLATSNATMKKELEELKAANKALEADKEKLEKGAKK